MYIEHDYSYVNKNLIEAGFAVLSFHSLRFDRYFTEEEKEANRTAAEKCGPGNSPEWIARCDAMAAEISRQMQNVLPLFSGYDIHQLTEETSTISHYRSDWDLFFYSNTGWNKRNFFDYFTLSANEKRTAAANMELLEKVLAMLASADIDAPNVCCTVQYTAVSNAAAIEKAALAIIERIVGKMIEYNGIVGKFRKFRDGSGIDCYGFFRKGARKYGYSVNPTEIVLSGL